MLSTDGYTPSFAALGRLALGRCEVAGLLSHAEKHSKLFCGRSVRRLGAGAAQLHSPTSASACRLENPVLARCTSSAGAAAGERRLHDDGGPRTGQGAAHCPPQGSGRHRAGQEAWLDPHFSVYRALLHVLMFGRWPWRVRLPGWWTW